MWRVAVMLLIVAALAFGAGWWLREQGAIDDCRRALGQWSEVSGHCYGSPYGEAEA
jgi:high-affinity Fe2+/Pb2+ permease